MQWNMENYLEVVGDEVISDLYRKASRLYAKHLVHVNSTFIGGGVAEILDRVVPLTNNLGVSTGWRVLHGNTAFFEITKKLHNGLQSAPVKVTEEDQDLYVSVNEEFAQYTHIDHDVVVVHDPQPLPLIGFSRKSQPWVWRCHIDLSDPNQELWQFLKRFILRYDVVIVSSESYRQPELPVEQRVIPPAIDPLSLKNREMAKGDVTRYIKQAQIPTDKPLLTQVSRLDPWKDPEGVLEVFDRVKRKVDCRLLYCYNLAADDPEGMRIYTAISEKAKDLVKRGDVIFVMGNNDYLVNAVQRASDVIIQKSTKEGFCLAVTEALWKGRPVVASNIGGLPLQVRDGETGYLVEPKDYDGFADRVVELMRQPKLARQLGEQAREFIRRHFLVTRLMGDHLDLACQLLQ